MKPCEADELTQIERGVRTDLVAELAIQDETSPAVTAYRMSRRVLLDLLALWRAGALVDEASPQRTVQGYYSIAAARKSWLLCCDRLRRDYATREKPGPAGDWTRELVEGD